MSDEREHDLFPPATPAYVRHRARKRRAAKRARELSLPVDSRPVTGEAWQQQPRLSSRFGNTKERSGGNNDRRGGIDALRLAGQLPRRGIRPGRRGVIDFAAFATAREAELHGVRELERLGFTPDQVFIAR